MACQNCGDCCRYVALEIPPENVPWLDLHGIPMVDEHGVRKLMIDSPCQWLDESTHRCSNYEVRPALCRAYLCSKARKGERFAALNA